MMPSVLGSGSGLIVSLTKGEMVLGMVVLTLVVKFLFSAVSFGSGAPGGIFFPLLILGALLGAVFAIFWTGSGVHQQFCIAWNDRVLYRDRAGTADRHHLVV